jgi:hypothetical protein
MTQIVINLLLGGIIGVICKIVYDKIYENNERKRVKGLLIIEMKSNLGNIHNLLKDLKTIETSPIKEHLEPFTLEETAKKIEESCKRELLDKCAEKIPFLGKKQMEFIFSFYKAFEDNANFLRDFPRFGGCISVHTNENVVNQLIAKCEDSLKKFETT